MFLFYALWVFQILYVELVLLLESERLSPGMLQGSHEQYAHPLKTMCETLKESQGEKRLY